VIVHAEVKEYGMVVDPGCMKCMDCVSVCPNDALYFGFGKPAIAVKKSITKNYSLTWPEELFAATVFFLSFLAVWDVYQLVQCSWHSGCVRHDISRRSDAKVDPLERPVVLSMESQSEWSDQKGRMGVLDAAIMWIGLNAHSGYVRYHETRGRKGIRTDKDPG
jgi:ferredoxin